MKTTKIFMLALAAAIISLQSCNFLEIDTEKTIASSDVDYTDVSAMYDPVVGAYQDLRTLGMHWVQNFLWNGRDDDVTTGRKDDQGDALLYGYRGGYLNPSTYWGLNELWVNMYHIIRTCNSSIEALNQFAEHIEKGSTDYATYLSYKGEVQTIRAWAYYMLVTTFGPTVIIYENNQTDFTRSTVRKVIAYNITELDDAAANMQRMRPNQMAHVGAFTAFSAQALNARFNLLAEDFNKVKTLTDDIITNGGFSLYPDYYNLFKIPGKLCDESLMEVQCTDYGVANSDYLGVDQWFNAYGGQVLVTATGSKIAGWNFMRYNRNFVKWATDRGETIRLAVTCMQKDDVTPEGDVVQNSYVASGKGYLPYNQMTPGSTEWGKNNNVRLLRYAEVLLMNAEAKIRLGESGDSPLNEVRTRSSMSTITGANLNDVLDERRMELSMEWGLRYTDLVRTAQAATILNSELCPRDEGKEGVWTTDKTYLPVPGTQLTETPSLANEPRD